MLFRLTRSGTSVCLRWTIAAILMLARTGSATERIIVPVHDVVQRAEAIVIVTVTDAPNDVLRVDETWKGSVPPSIRLTDYIDPWADTASQKLLKDGARELLFLAKRDDRYAPLDSSYRGVIRDGGVTLPWPGTPFALSDIRTRIRALVDLQAREAKAIGEGQAAVDRAADSLYLAALRGRDPSIKLWAAVSAPQHVQNASTRLQETYLRLWTSEDRNLRGHVYEGVTRWRIRSAAPMFARALRSADEDERGIAAHAVGGAGDVRYLSQLRAVAESDPSATVRSCAYDGLTHLIGAESLPDLWNAASDTNGLIRSNAAVFAFRLARRTAQPDVQAEVRKLLSTLAGDADPSVSEYSRDLLRQLVIP